MPAFDYHCPSCCEVIECRYRHCSSTFEAITSSELKTIECQRCGDVAERVWITAPANRFDSAVDSKGIDLRSASLQLGRKFESRSELDAYMEKEGLIAVTAKEFEENMPSSNRVDPPFDPKLDEKIMESLKKNEEKLAAGTLKPVDVPTQEVFDHVKKQTGIDFSNEVTDVR